MRDYTRVYYMSSEEWNIFQEQIRLWVLKILVSNFIFPLHRLGIVECFEGPASV